LMSTRAGLTKYWTSSYRSGSMSGSRIAHGTPPSPSPSASDNCEWCVGLKQDLCSA
jgi:hypothetical protein